MTSDGATESAEASEPEEEAPPLGPEPDERDERDERLFRRFAHQWALLREERDERRHEPPSFSTGPSNLRRAEVPYGLDLAAGWAWRLLLIEIGRAHV